jgi:DNA-binding response OmpR family regulator
MTKTILVVEDEPTLVSTLRYSLEREGYRVVSAEDGDEGVSVARQEQPDLILLDLMLPKLDGLGVCRILRREMQVPILILTAKGEEVDKVVGLELGADDYVTKPFGMRELLARVRALLRRAEAGPATTERQVLTAGDVQIDTAARKALRDGKEIILKPREYDLLVFMLKNKGQAFTRDQILNQVWGYDYAGDTRTVDVHVRWLREKIEREPSKPTRLITVRGTGYRFEG